MQSEKRTLLCADNMAALAEMPENSIDAVVTDPPYGLAFMGKRWDYDVPSVDLWRNVLRVLKPGGHVLAFGGTRTYHRMVVSIEDAGFEIRDQLQWLYGSGFPKSHNLKGEWQGWGTALKPANEPICLARKPLDGTVAENVGKWGVGGLNVDAGRIESGKDHAEKCKSVVGLKSNRNGIAYNEWLGSRTDSYSSLGRWPANVILDEEAAAMLDEQAYGASRFFYCAKASKRERNAGLESLPLREAGIKNDSGRGFSESDPHKKIMAQNHHPTVKPIALMRYLCKLITPPSGTILDPFMGSGTTGIAAKIDGFGFVGIELDADYFEIAQKRIESWVNDAK